MDDIQEVLEALRQACYAHPDQRVAQVLVNAIEGDPFYLSNKEFARKLRDYAEMRTFRSRKWGDQ